ncbi:nitrate- and nitrite sensing domain-containing protein [Streptomyces pathocidini]|uniref:histidine kinase n=3 Tax=Streptomyces pathocidini TaxID=1650571 RepID=A0ABW7UNU3_9ACTN
MPDPPFTEPFDNPVSPKVVTGRMPRREAGEWAMGLGDRSNPSRRPRERVSPTGRARSSSGPNWSPRHWRLTTRLVALLALPMLLCAALVAHDVSDSVERAKRKENAQLRTQLVFAATVAAHSLQNERDVAALAHGRQTPDVSRHREATDQSLKDFRSKSAEVRGSAALDENLANADKALAGLSALRSKAFTEKFGTLPTQQAYEDVITPLLALDTALDFGDEEQPMSEGWALHSLSIQKSALSGQRAVLNATLERGGPNRAEATAVEELRGVEKRARQEFRTLDAGKDVANYDQIVNSDVVPGMIDKVLANPKGKNGVSVQQWHRAATEMLDQLHEVETEAAQRLLDEATSSRKEATRQALTEVTLVISALLAALTIAVFMARTLIRRLRRLRRVALRVADAQLPSLVKEISARGGLDQVDLESAPFDLGVRDEIGEVSRAFDAVFHEAVKQAGEQAVLRTSVNTMLVALSRRSQGLIYRQLDLISALEQAEHDPKTLAELFHVDHLATRMRRHGENLLLLAGEEPGRTRTQPALLVDVIRAAAAEVEQYTRIDVAWIPQTAVSGPATHHLTHLLAELMENATQFSDPASRVKVMAAPAPGGALTVHIHDEGLGIPAGRLTALNDQLQHAPLVDVAATRCMGLHVVSRLAARLGVRVQLWSGPEGTTAELSLPGHLLLTTAAVPQAMDGGSAPSPTAPQRHRAPSPNPPQHHRAPSPAAPQRHRVPSPTAPQHHRAPSPNPPQQHRAPSPLSGPVHGPRSAPPVAPAPGTRPAPPAPHGPASLPQLVPPAAPAPPLPIREAQPAPPIREAQHAPPAPAAQPPSTPPPHGPEPHAPEPEMLASGLPLRVPMTALRPGSAGAEATCEPTPGGQETQQLLASELGQRVTSFCGGARRARTPDIASPDGVAPSAPRKPENAKETR